MTRPRPGRGTLLRALTSVRAVPGLGDLTLRRAWPRGADRLSLEYGTADGVLVAGQWRADADRLAEVARVTAERGPGATVRLLSSPRVLLQGDGADRRLPGLRPLVATGHGVLLAHRPERRAVVALHQDGVPRVAKVVRPGRSDPIVASAGAVTGRAGFDAPRVVHHDAAAGVVVSETLTGRSLRALVADGEPEAAAVVGAALRTLHDAPVPAGLPTRDAADEADWLAVWVRRVDDWIPDALPEGDAALETARARLLGGAATPTPPVAVHGDAHDQQALVGEDGRVGLLDWDTLARGEPALDLANLVAHLELRAVLGEATPSAAARAVASLLGAYRPSAAVRTRLADHATAQRLRLACVYAFRPGPPVRPTRTLGAFV